MTVCVTVAIIVVPPPAAVNRSGLALSYGTITSGTGACRARLTATEPTIR
jgi:hypothetical protein